MAPFCLFLVDGVSLALWSPYPFIRSHASTSRACPGPLGRYGSAYQYSARRCTRKRSRHLYHARRASRRRPCHTAHQKLVEPRDVASDRDSLRHVFPRFLICQLCKGMFIYIRVLFLVVTCSCRLRRRYASPRRGAIGGGSDSSEGSDDTNSVDGLMGPAAPATSGCSGNSVNSVVGVSVGVGSHLYNIVIDI